MCGMIWGRGILRVHIVLLTFIHEYSRLITHLFVKNILIHKGTPKNDDKDILFDDRLAIHL